MLGLLKSIDFPGFSLSNLQRKDLDLIFFCKDSWSKAGEAFEVQGPTGRWGGLLVSQFQA